MNSFHGIIRKSHFWYPWYQQRFLSTEKFPSSWWQIEISQYCNFWLKVQIYHWQHNITVTFLEVTGSFHSFSRKRPPYSQGCIVTFWASGILTFLGSLKTKNLHHLCKDKYISMIYTTMPSGEFSLVHTRVWTITVHLSCRLTFSIKNRAKVHLTLWDHESVPISLKSEENEIHFF